jgi:3'-phosphoadenosine 5'-phosphosulfate sulfotransferase (PAPS reductase)/FAD synthetase
MTTPWTTWTDPTTDLSTVDLIAVHTSAGKDSAAMLADVAARARAEGVLDRVVAIHADLGVMEWPGTRELAEQQARQVGVTRFEVVTHHRDGQVEDLLGYALRRRYWPDARNRWCTSSLKRDVSDRLLRRLADEIRAADPTRTTPVRILTCYGMRAAESPRRARQAPVEPYPRISTATRQATRWLPVHGWSTQEVFDRADAAGLTRHPAYAAGQSRASCVLCIFLRRTELVAAACLHPLLAQCYELVERAIGHTFRMDVSLADILEQAGIPPLPDDTPLDPPGWAALIRQTTRTGLPPALTRWADVVAYHHRVPTRSAR